MGTRLKLTLALVLLVLLAVGYAGATWMANQRTAAVVVENTAQALGVTTSLEYASVTLLTGGIRLSGLAADNPTGFDAPQVLLLPQVQGRVRVTTLLRPVVEMSSLTLSDLELHLERREGIGNYTLILDHFIREGRHLGDPDLRFVIETLVVRDAMVHLDLVPRLGAAGRLSVPIHELRLSDVGGAEQGLVLQEVVGVVIRSVLQAVLERVAREIPGALLRELRDRLEQLPEASDSDASRGGDVPLPEMGNLIPPSELR
jgi:hypothetical protein